MAQKTLSDLFHDTLKDVYFAERQIYRGLPKLAKAAQSEELKAAFLKHREETQGQIERLELVFEELGKAPRGKTCEAIKGLLEEGEEIIENYEDAPPLDAGLVASGQAIEHYEISRYGTLKTWAGQLGLNQSVKLLDQTLQEEKKTDELLTQIATSLANQKGQA
jgi:ferritin-like metal-binding protein YciE